MNPFQKFVYESVEVEFLSDSWIEIDDINFYWGEGNRYATEFYDALPELSAFVTATVTQTTYNGTTTDTSLVQLDQGKVLSALAETLLFPSREVPLPKNVRFKS